GTSVSFNATPTNGGSSPTYQWKKNNVNITTGSTYNTNTLNTNDAIKCVMTSNGTCITGNPATSNTITVSVTPNLTASVSISANPGNTICSGTPINFTATPINSGTSPSYQWKKNSLN